MTMYVYCVFLWQTIQMTTKFYWKEQKQALRTRQSIKSQFLLSSRRYNRYLRVYPLTLRLYHPGTLLHSLRRSRRLYIDAEGWEIVHTLNQLWQRLFLFFSAKFGSHLDCVSYKYTLYVHCRWHWDCTTLEHCCIAWGAAEGCTLMLKGGTISMPTGRHVDNDFIPGG
jgi:hypothetical protein